MNDIRFDCQVLVVGAGPTGLVLAAELLARGISVRIIDKGDGMALQSRAIGIHARTLEALDMMGLAERFIEHGQVVRHLNFYSEGRRLARLEFARCGSRFGFLLDLPQDRTERLLRARIAELGGVVENGVELVSLTAGGHGVSAIVRDHASRRTQAEPIMAGYVVGCDGAHSRVRSELDLTFHGHPYPQDSHPGGDPGAGRPAGAAAGHRVRSHLAGQFPLPSPVSQRLPARPRAAGWRRGAHPHPGRRSGH